MKRLAVAAALALTACGGAGFDADAVRADYKSRYPSADDAKIDELVDIAHDSCAEDDDTFQLIVLRTLDTRGMDGVTPMLLGCRDRTQAVLDDAP